MERLVAIIAFCLLAWCCIFLHLDTLSIRMYDESRNAVSAMDMMDNGEYLVRYWLGRPDTWETKPPLLIWLQAASMKVFGYNELAVRLPSALAALFTAIFLWLYCAKREQFWTGFWTAIVLIASPGFVDIHTARTGDHDTLVILFMTLYSLLVYDLIEHEKLSKKAILWMGLLVSLAVLTKSIAGFFAMPGLVVYILFRKKLSFFLTSKWFYGALAILVLIVGGYYSLREYFYPGQLHAIWEMELLPRYTNTSDGAEFNREGFWYYGRQFFTHRWLPFAWAAPLLIFFGLYSKQSRALTSFSLIQFLSLFIIISSGTKNVWYDAPMYPFMALLAGSGLTGTVDFLEEKGWGKRSLVIYVFAVLLVGFGAKTIIQKNLSRHTKDPWPSEQTGYLMRHALKLDEIPRDYFVVTEGYYSHALFYSRSFNKAGLGTIKVRPTTSPFEQGDVLLSCEPSLTKKLWERFPKSHVLHESRGCLFLRIEKKSE
jgi:4-amino-4-deoxy-L-arabinose transferase-like glycosyltransferase